MLFLALGDAKVPDARYFAFWWNIGLSDFRKNALMLSTHFLRRGYPKHLVENALLRAESLDRPTLISKNAPTTIPHQPNTNSKENCFYLVTTHKLANPPIRDIVEENWKLLSKSKTTRTLEDAEIIFGRRRNKNLADHLVRASTKIIEIKNNLERNPCKRSRTC